MRCQYCHRSDCIEPDGEPCEARIIERGKNPVTSMLRAMAKPVAADVVSVEAALEDFCRKAKKGN